MAPQWQSDGLTLMVLPIIGNSDPILKVSSSSDSVISDDGSSPPSERTKSCGL